MRTGTRFNNEANDNSEIGSQRREQIDLLSHRVFHGSS